MKHKRNQEPCNAQILRFSRARRNLNSIVRTIANPNHPLERVFVIQKRNLVALMPLKQ